MVWWFNISVLRIFYFIGNEASLWLASFGLQQNSNIAFFFFRKVYLHFRLKSHPKQSSNTLGKRAIYPTIKIYKRQTSQGLKLWTPCFPKASANPLADSITSKHCMNMRNQCLYLIEIKLKLPWPGPLLRCHVIVLNESLSTIKLY